MAHTVRLGRTGRGALEHMLAPEYPRAGIGHWEHAPVHARAAAFEARFCSGASALAAFRRLALFAEAHAGRLLHRPISALCPTFLPALRALAEEH